MSNFPLFVILSILAVPSFAADASVDALPPAAAGDSPASPSSSNEDDAPVAGVVGVVTNGDGKVLSVSGDIDPDDAGALFEGSVKDGADNGAWAEAFRKDREEREKRFVDKHPELKGADKAKIRKEMQEKMMKGFRDQMEKMKATERVKLQAALGMTHEEFAAVEPLLTRLDELRTQESMLDMTGMGQTNLPEGAIAFGGLDLNRSQPDATVKECQAAYKGLAALLADKQSNATEMTAAIARVRKGVAAFRAVLAKAQADLKAVLTPRQEATLMGRHLLD